MPSDLDAASRKKVPAVTNLGRLLARMALDEALYVQYLARPTEIIADAGLSKEERKALTDGNWQQILKLLGPGDRGGPNPGPERDSGDG